MKSVFAHIAIYVAILTAILPGQGVAELHKIPALIQHYQHHRETQGHGQLSIAAFLMMHYNETSSHKHEEDHDDLPLFHTCCVNVFFVTETTEITLLVDAAQQSLQPVEAATQYDYSLHHTIFQPPRFQSPIC